MTPGRIVPPNLSQEPSKTAVPVENLCEAEGDDALASLQPLLKAELTAVITAWPSNVLTQLLVYTRDNY